MIPSRYSGICRWVPIIYKLEYHSTSRPCYSVGLLRFHRKSAPVVSREDDAITRANHGVVDKMTMYSHHLGSGGR